MTSAAEDPVEDTTAAADSVGLGFAGVLDGDRTKKIPHAQLHPVLLCAAAASSLARQGRTHIGL